MAVSGGSTVLSTSIPGSLSFSSLVVEGRALSTTREEKEREPLIEVAVLSGSSVKIWNIFIFRNKVNRTQPKKGLK